MSKKKKKKKYPNRQKRAQKRRQKKKAKDKLKTLGDKLQEIYSQVNLETTCCRQCVCCSVACPQMNYSEATQILNRIWSKWSYEDKKALLITSIDYFFSNSMIKKCPLLGVMPDGKPGCRIYDDRPLNCRMYGQWTKDVYEARVKNFEEATGFDRSDLPLNTQCPHVRRVSEEKLDKELVDTMFIQLDELDRQIGEFSNAQMEQRYNYRTIHDWVLAKFWGDQQLSFWTEVFHAMSKEEVESLVETLHQQVEQMNL